MKRDTDNRTKTRSLLRVDDEVIVISGSERGKRGKLLALDHERGRVVVQGLNKTTRFQRPTPENPKGGTIEIERPLAISNVMFYDTKLKKGVRLGRGFKDGKKTRLVRPEGREV